MVIDASDDVILQLKPLCHVNIVQRLNSTDVLADLHEGGHEL